MFQPTVAYQSKFCHPWLQKPSAASLCLHVVYKLFVAQHKNTLEAVSSGHIPIQSTAFKTQLAIKPAPDAVTRLQWKQEPSLTQLCCLHLLRLQRWQTWCCDWLCTLMWSVMYAADSSLPQMWHGTFSSWRIMCARRRSLVAKLDSQVCGTHHEPPHQRLWYCDELIRAENDQALTVINTDIAVDSYRVFSLLYCISDVPDIWRVAPMNEPVWHDCSDGQA